MNFSYPLTRYERVTAVEWSLCAAKNSSCSKMNCPSDVEEMCGNDGVTYDNACHLREDEWIRSTPNLSPKLSPLET